jgi:hypothetical protein
MVRDLSRGSGRGQGEGLGVLHPIVEEHVDPHPLLQAVERDIGSELRLMIVVLLKTDGTETTTSR